MKGDAEKLNRDSFKEKLLLINSFDAAKALTNKTGKAPKARLLCANEKSYLGSINHYFMKALLILREDKKLFKFFINSLE